MDEADIAARFGVGLATGLLMGLERERHADAYAGLRTFSVVALLGTLCAFVAERLETPWLLPVGLASVAAMTIAAHRARPRARDAGITTAAALLLCFVIGASAWLGSPLVTVGVGLVATILLHLKPELHGFAKRLSRDDMFAVLRMVLVSVMVLPLLPDKGYGPYGALNPYKIWLLVVLISGLGLAGYLLMRLIGGSRGVLLLGVLGGLVSSTATTLSFSRSARASPEGSNAAATIILVANGVVLVRLGVLAAVLAPGVLAQLLPVLAAGLLAALAVTWRTLRGGAAGEAPEYSNPGTLREAVSFAVLFAVVQVAAAWLKDKAGEAGLYAGAALSGLTDVDAITLTVLEMQKSGSLASEATVTVIVIAYLANLLFKGVAVTTIAGGALARRVGTGFGLVASVLIVGWWLAT